VSKSDVSVFQHLKLLRFHIANSNNYFPKSELSNKQILRALDVEKLKHHSYSNFTASGNFINSTPTHRMQCSPD
jgi:hypothetical protein